MVAGVKWFPHNVLIMLVQASVEALLSSALKMISKNLQSSKLFFQARRWSSKLMRRHFLSSSRVVSFKVSVWQWRSYSIRSRTWWRSKNINYLLGTAFRLLLWIKKTQRKTLQGWRTIAQAHFKNTFWLPGSKNKWGLKSFAQFYTSLSFVTLGVCRRWWV